MPVARTDGRTHGHVITRSSGIGRLPHFLRYGATLARAPERGDPLKRWRVVIACSDWLLNLRIYSLIHLQLLRVSHAAAVTSKMASQFAAITNKEISQIIKGAVPETHEDGEEIRFGSFNR